MAVVEDQKKYFSKAWSVCFVWTFFDFTWGGGVLKGTRYLSYTNTGQMDQLTNPETLPKYCK